MQVKRNLYQVYRRKHKINHEREGVRIPDTERNLS